MRRNQREVLLFQASEEQVTAVGLFEHGPDIVHKLHKISNGQRPGRPAGKCLSVLTALTHQPLILCLRRTISLARGRL
jgi:hypothetical protein